MTVLIRYIMMETFSRTDVIQQRKKYSVKDFSLHAKHIF